MNYTGTYLADHLAGLSHDNVRYFSKNQRFTPRQLWQQVRSQVVLSALGYVLFDDTVLDKHHSRRIELVRRQYSGNAHGVIAGIGPVNYLYVKPETNQSWLIDYRLFAPKVGGKTKLDHVADRLTQLAPRGIPYRTVLMDSWYAITKLFKWLTDQGKIFYCPLKCNRLVDESGGRRLYEPIGLLSWSAEEVELGKPLKVKDMPKDCKLNRWSVLVSTHRTDYLLTNEVEPYDTATAE